MKNACYAESTSILRFFDLRSAFKRHGWVLMARWDPAIHRAIFYVYRLQKYRRHYITTLRLRYESIENVEQLLALIETGLKDMGEAFDSGEPPSIDQYFQVVDHFLQYGLLLNWSLDDQRGLGFEVGINEQRLKFSAWVQVLTFLTTIDQGIQRELVNTVEASKPLRVHEVIA